MNVAVNNCKLCRFLTSGRSLATHLYEDVGEDKTGELESVRLDRRIPQRYQALECVILSTLNHHTHDRVSHDHVKSFHLSHRLEPRHLTS